jgi:hypothetical protein
MNVEDIENILVSLVSGRQNGETISVGDLRKALQEYGVDELGR